MQEQEPQLPTDHTHRWVRGINFMGEICQICQWRHSPLTGEYAPPDPSASNPTIKE